MTAPASPTPAARAWAMLTHPTEPMPPQAALDWLRQEMDTDDVVAVKKALYVVAGESCGRAHREVLGYPTWPDGTETSSACQNIQEGHFTKAVKRVTFVCSHRGDGSKWDRWLTLFERTIAVCRQIKAL